MLTSPASAHRDRHVDAVEAQQLAALVVVARLDALLRQRRVQVDHVRHHRRAEDAGGEQHRVGAVEAAARSPQRVAGVEADAQRVVEEAQQDDAEEARRSRPRSAGSRASAARGSPNATTAVIRPAANSGTPKSRFSAIAAPTNSARSVDMAISSACTQSPTLTGAREVLAAQLRAGCLPGGDADLRREVLDQHRHQVRRERSPTAAGSRTWRRRRCSWRSCPGRRRRCTATNAGPSSGSAALQRRARERTRCSAVGDGRASSPAGGSGVHSSTRIAPRQRAAEHVDLAAEAREQRAVERLLLDDLEVVARARCRARRGSAASPGRSRRSARTGPRSPGAERLQADGRLVGASSRRASGSGRRAGRASGCRAWRRSAPRAPRRGRARAPRPRRGRGPTGRRATRQVELEQAVVAQDLQRDASALRRSAATPR